MGLHRNGQNTQYYPDPQLPPPGHMVHYSDWVSIATISSRDPIMDYPFSNVKTTSDGSSPSVARGIPYFYLSPMDLSSMDIWKNPKASLSYTLADFSCKEQGMI